MYRFFKIYFFFFLALSLNLNAQYAEFRHISTDDGLASSEVYCQLQDSSGYMWFGTSRGLSRYDGYEFKNYTASDGLPSNSIIKMFYDRFGRIWFATYDGALSYYENNEFHLFDLNDTLAALARNYFIQELYVDENKSLWVMPALGGIFEFTANGEIIDRLPKSDYKSFYFKDLGEGAVYSFIRAPNKLDSSFLDVKEDEHTLYGIKQGFRKNFLKIRLGEYLISVGENLYYVRNNHVIGHIKYNNEISGLFCDNEKNFWISVLYEGVYYYPNSDLDALPEIYLSGKSPIAVFQDHQNGYWLSTTENGVYYSPSFQFISYKRFGIPLFNILSIHIVNNTIYFSTFDRQVVKCNLNKHRIMSIENLLLRSGRDYAIQDITSTTDSAVWFLGKELIKSKGENVIIDTLTRSYKLFGKGKNVYLSTDEGLNIYCDSLCKTVTVKDFPTANAIYVDDENKAWVGTINGLYVFYDGKYEFLGDKNELLKSRVNEIAKFDKYLVIATNGNGIFLFNPKTNFLKVFEEKNGLNSNFVNTVYADKKDLWAGTNKGLCRINIVDHYDSLQIFSTKFTDVDGLYASEIKDIDKIDNCIFLGTTQGLISFYPEDIKKNSIPPELHFDSVLVNDFQVDIDTFYTFPFGDNTVTFYFKGISFSAGDKVKYKYRLEGYDDKWLITANRFLRFPNLQPGEYSLLVISSADGVVWNEQPLKVSFKIKNKFTNTIFFYALMFILFAILVFAAITYRFSILQKDLKLKRRMMRAEQKALRSQMNPHFIFNALNSIRRYILENDSDNADFYLTSFATLMRKVLDNSKQEFISLEEEINTLKLYLELEKMRFDDSFTFQIEIDEDLRISLFNVPPMVIQPILENAVWHGLAPLQKNGLLKLAFKKETDNSMICIVEDNGIGREKAAEIAERRKGHQSTGVKNLEERLNLLNSVGVVNIDYKVLDLFDASGNATGTKVELKFQYNTKSVKKKTAIKIFGKKIYFRMK
ncbi:MAG: histidine kinase [Bacteroidales bacterium]|nr:histidine kinase [Bacteroidales bacterium]